MANQDFSLPIDIPWKRLGASADMMDTTFGDSQFPPKWRSSIAVFYHEPDVDDLPETYCDRRITYLKIAYSITGYQLDQKEVEFEFDSEDGRKYLVPIAVRAKGVEYDNAWPQMELKVNNEKAEEWEVNTPDNAFQTYESAAYLVRGHNLIEVDFINGDLVPGDRELLIDSISIGRNILAPDDPTVVYNYKRRIGRVVVTEQTPGQRQMSYQGQLQFSFDYDPSDRMGDWMAQLIDEYENIGAYLPCYGALMHVAVFPSTQSKTETKRECISFADLQPSDNYPNPLDKGRVEFRVPNDHHNVIAKGGENLPNALRLHDRMSVRFPLTSRLEAKVYHEPEASVTITARSGKETIRSEKIAPQPYVVRPIVFEGQEFDSVVFDVRGDEAFLAEICYDAIEKKAIELEDYPYIMSFEPQKREMYETVTESGESMSRSLSNINVRKGLTSTDSDEVVDIDRGGGFSLGLGIPDVVGVSLGYQSQKEQGTRNIDTQQRENVRTTDTSREMREMSSHTTTLSQMYHLFNGYHLGTNRALFLMLPRPHVTEITENGKQVRAFANGPRKLEGVQEVFLVVNRPKSVPSICVETLLETAHLEWKPLEEQSPQTRTPEVTTQELEGVLTEAFQDTGGYNMTCNIPFPNSLSHFVIDRVYWGTRNVDLLRTFGIIPADGPLPDSSTNYFLADGHVDSFTFQGNSGSSATPLKGLGLRSPTDIWTMEQALDFYYRKLQISPDLTAPLGYETTTTMIITARSIKACLPGVSSEKHIEVTVPEAVPNEKEYVSLETRVQVPRNVYRASGSNQLVQNIGGKLQASLSSRERYPSGAVDFLHTKYALDRLKRRIIAMPNDDPHNRPIQELEQIHPELRQLLREAFPEAKTRKDLLSIPLGQMSDKLRLSPVATRDLQLKLIGIVPQPIDPGKPLVAVGDEMVSQQYDPEEGKGTSATLRPDL